MCRMEWIGVIRNLASSERNRRFCEDNAVDDERRKCRRRETHLGSSFGHLGVLPSLQIPEFVLELSVV